MPVAEADGPCEQTSEVPAAAQADLCSFGRKAMETTAGRQDEAGVIIVPAPVEAPATAAMPLPELLRAVNQLGGRFCNRKGQIVVENVTGNLPPGVGRGQNDQQDAILTCSQPANPHQRITNCR